METIAKEAELSATNVTQQTPEILADIDNGLTSVAEFVRGPNSSVIDYSTVSKTYYNSCLLYNVCSYNIIIIGCGECCEYYQFTTPLVTGFYFDLQQFTVGDLFNVNSTIQ